MLTKEVVLSKCHVESLSDVKKLTLWGSDLENIDIISELTNLEIASLSINKISSLKPFENCANLKELYLRKNNISNIEEIAYLKKCTSLRILWLEENPICELPNYREQVLQMLPQVMKLDNILTTQNNSTTPTETPPPSKLEIVSKPPQSAKRPPDNTMVSNILKNFDSSMTINDTTINNNNNTPVVTNGSLTKAEDYINKLDNIDDIKNFFNSPYAKNEQPVKIKQVSSVENYSNFKLTKKDIETPRQPVINNYAVTDSLNNISPKNVHVVSAIMNLMEDLNLRELIHVRNHIIKKLKK